MTDKPKRAYETVRCPFTVVYPKSFKYKDDKPRQGLPPLWEGRLVRIVDYCPPESWADPDALCFVQECIRVPSSAQHKGYIAPVGGCTWIERKYLIKGEAK